MPDTSANDIDARIGRWLDDEERWKSEIAATPYDGVVGSLPDWIPRGINGEFVRIRNNLLRSSICGEQITPALVLTWIDRYARLGETDEDEYIPSEVFEVVGQLARWRYAVQIGQQKGPQEGLKILGVPNASFLAGRKQGAYRSDTIWIVKLLKMHPHESAADLYRTLRSVAREPLSRHNPTPGECPFNFVTPNTVMREGKKYPSGTFRNMISKLRQHIANGEFSDVVAPPLPAANPVEQSKKGQASDGD
jgi:hypothetical protein